jgi:5-methylcytosine-specific restriction endonuclease McrA
MAAKPQRCQLCGRQVSELTVHHLVPRTRHNNRRVRRDLTRREVRQALALLCRGCHNFLHATFTEKTLEREFSTLEALASSPQVAQFVDWLRRKPADFHPYTREAQHKQ